MDDTNLPVHPKSLDVSIGGHFGPSYHVKWEDGQLVYRAYEEGKETEVLQVQPDPRSWELFWKQMDVIGVWEWRDHYEPNHPVMDGTGWEMKLHVDDRFVESGGNNAYPVDGLCAGADEVTPVFRKFLKAVRRLVGDVLFE